MVIVGIFMAGVFVGVALYALADKVSDGMVGK